MENDFVLPVEYAGEVLQLPARIVQFGFVVKLEVVLKGLVVTFEPDEERNWRAVMGFEDLVNGKKIDRELLEAVAEVIGEITK